LQVPEVVVTVVAGLVVKTVAATEGTGVAAGVCLPVINGETEVFFVEEQPAITVMTMITA
jgi:hypothetical protein